MGRKVAPDTVDIRICTGELPWDPEILGFYSMIISWVLLTDCLDRTSMNTHIDVKTLVLYPTSLWPLQSKYQKISVLKLLRNSVFSNAFLTYLTFFFALGRGLWILDAGGGGVPYTYCWWGT